jgi:hypothetical protein
MNVNSPVRGPNEVVDKPAAKVQRCRYQCCIAGVLADEACGLLLPLCGSSGDANHDSSRHRIGGVYVNVFSSVKIFYKPIPPALNRLRLLDRHKLALPANARFELG